MIACNLCFRIFAILCFVSIFLPVLPNYSISLYARLSYISTFFAFYPPLNSESVRLFDLFRAFVTYI